jgi:predicted nucleotidyltransferase
MAAPTRRVKVNSGVALLDEIREWPSSEAKAWAYREIPNLCRNINIKAVILFGSIVRNVPLVADLDVLYIYQRMDPPLRTAPIDVDLRKFESKDVEGLLENGNDLLGWCVKFGRLVCERDKYWSHIVERWSTKLAAPSRSVALSRAKKSEQLLRAMDAVGDNDAALEIYLSLLTHIARANLIQRGVYPESRAELSGQLNEIGECKLASYLDDALRERNAITHGIRKHSGAIWRRFLTELGSIANYEAVTADSNK